MAPWDRSNLVAAEVRQNYLSEITSDDGVGLPRTDRRMRALPRSQVRSNPHPAIFIDSKPSSMPFKPEHRSMFPSSDKAMAAKSKQQVEAYAKRLEDGPEKRELDTFEAHLLKKLVAAKAERAKGKPFEIADLRLELKLKQERLFTEQEQQQHADLLAAAQRTAILLRRRRWIPTSRRC